MLLDILGVVIISCLCALFVNYYSYNKALDQGSIVPFKDSVYLLGVPVVTFDGCNNQRLNLLLDTGSDYSYIDIEAAKALGIKEEDLCSDGIGDISGVGGSVKSYGAIKAKFGYNNVIFEEIFRVVDLSSQFSESFGEGCTVHGVLGSNFFDNNNYILDYQTMTMYKKS